MTLAALELSVLTVQSEAGVAIVIEGGRVEGRLRGVTTCAVGRRPIAWCELSGVRILVTVGAGGRCFAQGATAGRRISGPSVAIRARGSTMRWCKLEARPPSVVEVTA
jgi:hypothetical protein